MASKKRKGAGPEAEANARAREDALAEWVEAIAGGQTQRGAAVPLLSKYGFTYGQLLGWCERDPERWGKALDAARATKVERMEGVVRRIALAEPGDLSEDPASARARIAAATWLLSKWDRAEYGEKVTTEHTGKDGGPIETKARLAVLEVPPNKLIKGSG